MIYLNIGSNLPSEEGGREINILKAINHLKKLNLNLIKISSFYETPSWPNKRFPKFLNIIIKINTNLSLIDLFLTIKNIEKKIGRKKALRNYPRVCDIDIIDFKGLIAKKRINNNLIEVPHPRMNNRNFVIFPLFEVNKTWIHPKTKANISSIINQFSNSGFSDIRIV